MNANAGDRPWTREDVIASMQALAREGWAPTPTEMGERLASAAVRLFGTLTRAAETAGLQANHPSHRRPAYLRGPMWPTPEPMPPPEPPRDPMLRQEFELYLARRKAAAVESSPPVRYPPGGRKDFRGKRLERDDDYLPPQDLNAVPRPQRPPRRDG